MASVAYLILCHQNADNICSWVDAHLSKGCFAAIHFDKNGSDAEFQKLDEKYSDNDNVLIVPRMRCGWGEWSLVQATLSCLKLAEQAFPKATHFLLTSGDCAPIKSAKYISDFLDQENKDYIEHKDFEHSGWIKTGMVADRFQYRHFFNERKSKGLFYKSLEMQRRFGLSRSAPKGIDMKIGSQWWCLRRKTIEAVLDFTKTRSDVMRFFKSVWIPDESFFQTIVTKLIPKNELIDNPITYLMFSDYGMPVTYHGDHFDYLRSRDRLFARKISPHSDSLREQLIQLYKDDDADIQIENNGSSVYEFLVQSGRKGHRFSRRYWEKGQTVGREKKLSIILCKDWHLGQRVLSEICNDVGGKGFAYLFNDSSVELPDLGGIQGSIDKLSRHRRAVMRLLFEDEKSDHLYICVDPTSKGIVDDFYTDECEVRTLHVRIPFTPKFCAGHAYRTGVLADPNGDGTDPISKAVYQTLENEVSDIQAVGYQNYYEVSRAKPKDMNTKMMADFLERGQKVSEKILTASGYLKESV